MKKDKYTAGELAKVSGVSIRTIRFYDKKGILKPSSYSDSGYRLYDSKSLENLQKILMLKFLGFSLEDINKIFNSSEKENLKECIHKQKKLLIQKKEHLERVILSVDKLEKADKGDEWQRIIDVLEVLTEKEDIIKHYIFIEE